MVMESVKSAKTIRTKRIERKSEIFPTRDSNSFIGILI
jgi:hypothetical protein